ncbi:MAG: putative toxin-antitoxin system toxin component, PIN family [Terriglobia bacterium]
MRCVLDTHVFVSALLSPASKPRMAVDRAKREGAILLSYAVLAELFEVLHREKFHRYIDEEDIRSFLAALTREAEWVNVLAEVTACRDPKDDKFLSLAVSGNATHIVTGDADLLVLQPFRGIEIVSPGAFVEVR